MKHFFSSLFFSFLFFSQVRAQSPSYFFSAPIDTAIESNASIIAGYVKTTTAPTVPDSIVIILRSGSPRSSHIDTTSRYVVHFNPGQDSAAFVIRVMKDTFPEFAEHILYVLTNPVNGSLIGTDSSLHFVLVDSTPPATIKFIVDSMWCYEGTDSFYNGVYVPFPSNCYVGITVNNPNPFFVRYYANNFDCQGYSYNPYLTACSLNDYYFNGETCYAPPGISTYYKVANMVDHNSTYDKHFICYLANIDANIITDTFTFFTIKHVNYFDTPTLSFDHAGVTIVGDSLPHSLSIPITIVNPNRKPLYFHIDTIQSTSTYPGINYSFNNLNYGYSNGTSHDTFTVHFTSSHRSGDTISILFALRNDSINGSPDTLYRITVIDTGGLTVSFLGAGLAHLKSDSIGYVKLYTSSIAKYDVSARVSYLNGNAVRGLDFTFNDTTIIFPALQFDTISLPVIMLQDHLYQGNTQVNLQLTNVSPSIVIPDIIQYTYTIIDNEDSGFTPLGVHPTDPALKIKMYPNPFDNDIHIETNMIGYQITITNSLGEKLSDLNDLSGSHDFDLADLPSGLYMIRVSYKGNSYTQKIQKL